MGHFQALPDVVAVAGGRLAAIVRVDYYGSVVVRDLANGGLSTTSAAGLSAPMPLDGTSPTITAILQATDAQWERARRRERAIAGVVANAPDLADRLHAYPLILAAPATVFRWLAAYRKSPQTSSLLTRPSGTPSRRLRIDRTSNVHCRSHSRCLSHRKVRAKKEEVVRRVGLRCVSERLTPPSRTPSSLGSEVWTRAR